MKVFPLRKRRDGGGEGRPFAFFAVGALVVLAAVFVVGLQLGRYIEKRERDADLPQAPSAAPGSPRDSAESIRKDLGAFSTEAEGVKSVPPPVGGGEAAGAPAAALTFPEALSREKPGAVPHVGKETGKGPGSAKSAPGTGEAKDHGYSVQAGTFRNRAAAVALRDRLNKAGYKAAVKESKGKQGPLHRVVVGPYEGREGALKALRKMKSDQKISGILIRG